MPVTNWFLLSTLICSCIMTIRTILNAPKKSAPGTLLLSWMLLLALSLLEGIIWSFSEEFNALTLLFFLVKLTVCILPQKLSIEVHTHKFQLNFYTTEQQLRRRVLLWYYWFCLRVLAIEYRNAPREQQQFIKQSVQSSLGQTATPQQPEPQSIHSPSSRLINELQLYKSPLAQSL